jgi:hypothetical protein
MAARGYRIAPQKGFSDNNAYKIETKCRDYQATSILLGQIALGYLHASFIAIINACCVSYRSRAP